VIGPGGVEGAELCDVSAFQYGPYEQFRTRDLSDRGGNGQRGLRVSKQSRVLRRALGPRLRGAVAPSDVSHLHGTADKASDRAGCRCARGNEIRRVQSFRTRHKSKERFPRLLWLTTIGPMVLSGRLVPGSRLISRLLRIGSCGCQVNFFRSSAGGYFARDEMCL
jgi:hypothetical protein